MLEVRWRFSAGELPDVGSVMVMGSVGSNCCECVHCGVVSEVCAK